MSIQGNSQQWGGHRFFASALMGSRVEHEMTYHPPESELVRHIHEVWNQVMHDAAMELITLTPDSREQSLALTALQECRMWGNAAIALHQDAFPQPEVQG